MLGGTFAVSFYTGISRTTKDMDLFCKNGDYPRILKLLTENGYKIEITDARWLAKARLSKNFIDFIFGSAGGIAPVDQSWFEFAPITNFLGFSVQIIPTEELIWSKSFVQHRERSEGPDVNHLILKKGNTLDWNRLAMRMESHWEVLLSRLIEFRFVYPSERKLVPKWLLKELLERLNHELNLPEPKEKITRGPLLSRVDYEIDINDWGYKTIQ
jgi:hypothetical protein